MQERGAPADTLPTVIASGKAVSLLTFNLKMSEEFLHFLTRALRDVGDCYSSQRKDERHVADVIV